MKFDLPALAFLLALTTFLLTGAAIGAANDLLRDGDTEGFVDSDGVKIHYVTRGEGPLVVLLHGFPDFWYSWRKQMPALAEHFQVVAIDMRGYNKSDQPDGVENYKIDKLVADVAAVVKHFGRDDAVIVGHDWGGFIAWSFAAAHPEMTQRLVILNLPHPNGLMRELKNNPAQQKASEYARNFQKEDAAKSVPPEALVFWVTDRDARPAYLDAMRRSSMEGMLNYYKANFPRPDDEAPAAEFPKIDCPVLMFHGLKDEALLPGALNDTWNWLGGELTLITLPGAGHFVQQDAADVVTRRMVGWLTEASE